MSGLALFVECKNEKQIQAELKSCNVPISIRQVGYLAKKFIVYLAVAHKESRSKIKDLLSLRGGYILHLDGTCEGDSPHLMSALDEIAQIVLDNIKIPSEKADKIIPFLRRIKQSYGIPLALVHDMGAGIVSAVKEVFPGVADYVCHYHFLRDIGNDQTKSEVPIRHFTASITGHFSAFHIDFLRVKRYLGYSTIGLYFYPFRLEIIAFLRRDLQ